jgi:outer membrane protein insertion porin family
MHITARGFPAVLLMLMLSLPVHAQKLKKDKTQPQVWSVEIKGNYTYGDFVLNDIMLTKIPSMLRQVSIKRKRNNPVVEQDLKDDAIRIERFYQRRGYPEVRVTFQILQGDKKWRRIVRFNVIEGRKLLVAETRIQIDADSATRSRLENNDDWQKIIRRQPFRKGRRFESVRIGEYTAGLENALKDIGYAFAQVRVSAETPLNTGAVVSVDIKPGALAYLDSITVTGFKTVPEKLVRRETTIKTGDRYSRKALAQAQRDLIGHHLFRYATVTFAETDHPEKLNVKIQVAERPLRAIELRAGVGNEDLLRGQATWTHRNLWGDAHSLGLSGKASFIEQRIGASYLIPYVFNNKSSVNVSPFAYNLLDRGFQLMSYGINNSFVYQASRNLTTSVSHEFTINDESLPEKATRAMQERQSRLFNLSSITIAAFYDAGYLTDGEGWIVQPSYQVSGLSKSTDFHFQKIALDIRNYTRIGRNTELAIRVNPGVMFDIRQDTLPSSVRFFLGGSNSIRGFFRQNLGPKTPTFDASGRFTGYVPAGGIKQFGFNTEIRQKASNLGRGMGLAFFLDGGQVWGFNDEVSFSSLQYAAGLGLRWRSPVGPVRFDVGYKLNPEPEDLNRYQGRDYGYFFDRFGFHISVGQAF